MAVSIFVAFVLGVKGILMYGCWSGSYSCKGCEFSFAFFFCLLELLTLSFPSLAMGEEAALGDSDLVLLMDPVTGVMVLDGAF